MPQRQPSEPPKQVNPAQSVLPPGTPGTGEALCPVCSGKGTISGRKCQECDGTGIIIQGIGGA